jgi:hypothetical protein
MNTIKLGKEKIVTIKPWKTKTKKEFLNLIKKNNGDFKNIKESEVLKVLLTPYIEPNDIFLSDAEKEYLIICIRNISLDNNISFLIECSGCGEKIPVKCEIMDLVKYQENQYPIILNDISWIDIKNNTQSKYKDYMPGTIEMLSHISDYKGEVNLDKMVEIYDNMELKESDDLYKDYTTIRSSIKIEREETCPYCSELDTYYLESVPDLFEPLLPKE